MREELLKGLSDEQKKKVAYCKSAEDVLALAKAEGVELNDEQLEAVSGGACDPNAYNCPKCGSSEIEHTGSGNFHCRSCNHNYNLLDIEDQLKSALKYAQGAVQ